MESDDSGFRYMSLILDMYLNLHETMDSGFWSVIVLSEKNRKIFEISFDFFKIYAILYSVKEIRGFASDGHIEKSLKKVMNLA